ncbi:uncharacterized protein [Watersipora subatra]|uniref:uncharacterized protein n=1 Tax=Watersipora subatra TaxID=2589382 RepID=UPI00355B11B0
MATLLRRHPLVAGMLTYSSVWSLSSITQQKYISKHKVDYKVVARNVAVATFMMAPLLHGWYRLMAIWSKGARTWQWSIKITVSEQVLFGPVITSVYFIGSGVLAGSSAQYIKNELVSKFPRVYLTACTFFPFVNFINHLYVPLRWKIIYQAFASFIWSNFLCYMKEKKVMAPSTSL